MQRGTAQSIVARGDRVSGVVVDRQLIEADVVIVAAGPLTRLGVQYRAPGRGQPLWGLPPRAHVPRQRRRRSPSGSMTIATLYQGYLAAVFPQDDRTHSVLIGRPTANAELAGLRHVDAFEAATRQIPRLTPWTDPDRFVPITPVLDGSNRSNAYRSGLDDNGRAALAGLFFVGDAFCTTNPTPGRGISLGLRQGQSW